MRELSSDEFFSAVEAGAEVVPTDKNYKVYVRHVGREDRFTLTELTPHGRARFIVMLNHGNMTLADPGYFPVEPFFMRTAPRVVS